MDKSISHSLGQAVRPEDLQPITIGQLLARLGPSAFALAMLLFALPNTLPIPMIPGVSTLTGVPIIIIAWQMLSGKRVLSLPAWVARRRICPKGLKSVLAKLMPYLLRVERCLRPRMSWACSAFALKAIGMCVLILAVMMALPLPGTNFLPGIAITLIALGILAMDGLAILGGLCVGIAGIGVVGAAMSIIISYLIEWAETLMLYVDKVAA